MPALNRTALKAFFETGDIPTEAQFIDLIDSFSNIADNYNFDPGFLRQRVVTVPTAQVLTLNTIPVELIPAPGPGLMIVPVSMATRISFNLFAYATNVDIQGIFAGAVLHVHENLGLLATTFDVIVAQSRRVVVGVPISQMIIDTAYNVRVPFGNPTVGDSDIRVYISYYIVTA